METEYEVIGRNLVIRLPEELDHHNCRSLQRDADSICRSYCINRVVFDFSRVVFTDSSGIGAILGRYKEMKKTGGDVAVFGAGKRILRILCMSGVDKLAEMCGSLEEALR